MFFAFKMNKIHDVIGKLSFYCFSSKMSTNEEIMETESSSHELYDGVEPEVEKCFAELENSSNRSTSFNGISEGISVEQANNISEEYSEFDDSDADPDYAPVQEKKNSLKPISTYKICVIALDQNL